MRISRKNLTIETAADDSGRTTIESILFDRDGTVSADGFRLTFVPYPDGPASEDDQAVGMILPIADARRVADVADDHDVINVARSLGETGAFVVSIQPRARTRAAVRFDAPAVEGPYPNTDKIIPTSVEHEIALQTAYLRAALHALEEQGATAVRIGFNGDREPVLIRPVGPAGPAARQPFVVAMPMYRPK